MMRIAGLRIFINILELVGTIADSGLLVHSSVLHNFRNRNVNLQIHKSFEL